MNVRRFVEMLSETEIGVDIKYQLKKEELAFLKENKEAVLKEIDENWDWDKDCYEDLKNV